jgi:hypothetical protein
VRTSDVSCGSAYTATLILSAFTSFKTLASGTAYSLRSQPSLRRVHSLFPTMTSLLLSLSSSSRLRALLPISRSLSTRARPIPETRGEHLRLPTALHAPLTGIAAADSISTPGAFLKAIGRSCDTKLSIESWDDFWKQDGTNLKSAGVGVRDRRSVFYHHNKYLRFEPLPRYILWCMEKYRSGLSVKEFAHEPRPKKTIRG